MTDDRFNHEDEEARREVRITDRRRVRLDEPDATPGPAEGEDAPAEEISGPAAEGGPRPVGKPQDELSRAKAEAAEYLDHLQRLKAEFDNYRKRVLREQTRAVEAAVEPVVVRLLEVLDEFELALVAAGQKPDFDKFLRGVEMVYAKLFDALRAEGVERIDAEGKPFDPGVHEALFEAPGQEGDAYVADVLRPGYTVRGRVVRPAGVKVERR